MRAVTTVTKNTDSLLLLLNPTVQALTGLLSLRAQADSLLIKPRRFSIEGIPDLC